MKKLNLILIIITLALSSFFTACSNKNSNNRYEVYYFDPVAKELIIRKVVIKEDDTISVAEQLFSKLKESSEKMQSVCPDYLNLEKIEIEKKIMNVYLSEGYINMNNVERAVFEAGTVKTLCQIADIEYIHLFSGGQPVIDEKGMDRGLLSNRSFITTDRIGDDEDTYFTTILYFADSSGTMLVGEKTDIIFSSNYSREQLVIERLIKGPSDSTHRKTLPSKLRVLGTYVKNGVCYVNLDNAFLKNMVDIRAELTIYSIVNSLCELSNIYSVKILVSGSENHVFRDVYPLNLNYGRNLDYIEKGE